MPLYESTFIARQDISTADVEKLTETFSNFVTEGGGKIVKTEYWGLRNMAYKVNKNKKGHYVMLGIDAPSAAVKEMERNIGLNEDVIRNLTIRVEEIDKAQSPVMTAGSYDDQDRGYGNREGGGYRGGDRNDNRGENRGERSEGNYGSNRPARETQTEQNSEQTQEA